MTPEGINEFFAFLYQGRLGEITFWLRLIAGVITSALLAAIVVIAVKFRELGTKGRYPRPVPAASLPSPEVAAIPWQEVVKKLASASPSDWNLAVIRADSILDAVLKEAGLQGQTLGERLKQLDASKLASVEEVWEAHKIRNRIVHETDPVLTREEARYAARLFEKALQELSYLPE